MADKHEIDGRMIPRNQTVEGSILRLDLQEMRIIFQTAIEIQQLQLLDHLSFLNSKNYRDNNSKKLQSSKGYIYRNGTKLNFFTIGNIDLERNSLTNRLYVNQYVFI